MTDVTLGQGHMENETTMPRGPTLSVVIPVYDEAAHLSDSLAHIRRVLDGMAEPYELIVIDDGSRDATWNTIVEAAANGSVARGLRLSRNFGKEAALCAGLERARGEAVVVMDGDLQHPPELISQMVSVWRESGCSIVEAVKTSRGRESLTTKAGSKLFYGIVTRLSGFDLRGASDFKLLDRRALDAWLQMKERTVFFRGMTAWLGHHRRQVPFAVDARAGGRSRWGTLRLVRLAFDAVTAFSSLPLQLVTFAGLAFFFAAGVLGVQTLLMKASGRAVDGFTTVILLQLIIGSLLMLSLGIIGQYLAKVYDEVKGRPRYLVAAETLSQSTGDSSD